MKTIIFVLLLTLIGKSGSSQENLIFSRIDSLIHEKDLELSVYLCRDTSLNYEFINDLIDYFIIYYSNDSSYLIRYNIIRLLTCFTTPLFDSIPDGIRKKSLFAIVQFMDHSSRNFRIKRFIKEDYDSTIKAMLIKIFRRQYDFDIEASYARYRYPGPSKSLKQIASHISNNREVDYETILDSMYNSELEKYQKEYISMPPTSSLIRTIAWLDIKDCIPDLLNMLKNNLSPYNSAVALARMDVMEGVEYLLEQSDISWRDAFFTGNQDVIYKYIQLIIHNEELVLCGSSLEELYIPRCYQATYALGNYITNMPEFFEGNPCFEKFRDKNALNAAIKWLEDNKGNYVFDRDSQMLY